LKNAPFDEVSKVYEGAPMMYKSIERLNGDPTPLKKLADDYVSGVSAYLALRQAVMYLALQNSEHTTLKEPRSRIGNRAER